MEKRMLGPHLQVSALGLGCMGMTGVYGPLDEEESLRTLQHALDRGVTFLDTADAYALGRNEELVGRAIRGRRDEVTLATKFGFAYDEQGKPAGVVGRPEYVRAACEASLRRLGVETIDLYYQHRVDPNTPIEETIGAMAELVQAGKVRFLGMSEAAPATLRRAVAVHPITALQTEYSLWTREPEEGLLALCRELNIGFVAYSPLGRGFLTGRFRKPEEMDEGDYRRQINPRFQKDNFEHNMEIVRRVEVIAAEKGCTAAQLALAWLLAKGKDIVPIPGTKRRKYLDENIMAAGLTLSDEDVARIDAAAPRGFAAGDRYPAASMTALNQ